MFSSFLSTLCRHRPHACLAINHRAGPEAAAAVAVGPGRRGLGCGARGRGPGAGRGRVGDSRAARRAVRPSRSGWPSALYQGGLVGVRPPRYLMDCQNAFGFDGSYANRDRAGACETPPGPGLSVSAGASPCGSPGTQRRPSPQPRPRRQGSPCRRNRRWEGRASSCC